MTAQIDDIFIYQANPYAIAGISNPDALFDPKTVGLHPMSHSTACWRGYQCIYGIEDGRLVLLEFSVNTSEIIHAPPRSGLTTRFKYVEPPKIGECVPQKYGGRFEYEYENFNFEIDYSGGILLATGFIEELYEHMGFAPAWKYEEVHELIFEHGLLVSNADVSDKVAELREKMKNAEPYSSCIEWIHECFSREYAELS